MSQNYHPIWSDVGLDLNAHDAWLNVLEKSCVDIFLSQNPRLEGMQYFDFVMGKVYGLRIKELLDEKNKIENSLVHIVLLSLKKIVLAADDTLIGLCSGTDFVAEEVEQLLPRNTCALVKSSLWLK